MTDSPELVERDAEDLTRLEQGIENAGVRLGTDLIEDYSPYRPAHTPESERARHAQEFLCWYDSETPYR